jgi:hypothetical protein
LIEMLETSPRPFTTDILRLLNVKYLLWAGPLDDPYYKLLRKMEPLLLPERGQRSAPAQTPPVRVFEPHLYELQNALPRAALIPGYRVVNREKDLGEWIKTRRFDPTETVLLEEIPRFIPGLGPVQPVTEGIRRLQTGMNHLTVQAVCREPRMLLLSEVDYPGWQVRVNGRPEKICRANHAFRAVALGPGTHEVRFEYRPRSFYWGLVITLVALGGIILGVLLALRGRKKERIRTAMARGTDQVVAEHPAG